MGFLFLSENVFRLGSFIECDDSWFPNLNYNTLRTNQANLFSTSPAKV